MYAKINPDRKTLTPAPKSYGATCNPSAATHLAHGFKPVRPDAPPPAEEGHYVRPTGYDEDETTIWRTYEQVPLPPAPPRVFSTADVIEGLMQAGVWPQVRTFIDSRGMIDMVLATKEFSEDDPNFTGPRDELKAALGWTDEQVEALLARCVKE